MTQKTPNRNKSVNDKSDSWYKNPSLIISIASIALSAVVGVLSILNSNSIAHLNKEVYIPILQYRIGQEQDGYFYFEVTNHGLDSAKGIIMDINWKSYIQLSECSSQPPYQDIKPTEPQIANNLTYRLNVLEMEAAFKVVCKIIDGEGSAPDIMPKDTVGVYVNTDALNVTKATTTIILPAGATLPANLNLTIDLLPPDSISIKIVAENAKPATNAEQLSSFLGIRFSPTQTATPKP